MWEELAELLGGGGLPQDLLAQCLFHFVLTTVWAPLNAFLALWMKQRGLVVIGLAEVLLVLVQRPPVGFLAWEVVAITLSLTLSYAWVYFERPEKWDRVGFLVGALLVALGLNGVIVVMTIL